MTGISTRRRRYALRSLTWIVGIPLLSAAVYFLILWPWLSRWGATDAEVEQILPGDELIPNPVIVTTKAVTIQAPPEAIWPWLAQLGVDRGGMYSYLWVENWLLRLGVHNSDEIRPEWQNLRVGDFIRFTPPGYALNPGPGLYVLAIEPNHALVGCYGMENSAPDCTKSGTWQFVLAPQSDGATRLILRSNNAGTRSVLATAGGKAAQLFVFYMERKMLLGIKARAERFAAHKPIAER
jgi:hypothetical protein